MKTFAAVAPLLFALCAAGQEKPSFEVASIKPAAPQDMRRMMVRMGGDPGRINYTNVNLRNVLQTAYDVKGFQISGPSWLDTERFDIIAKLPEGAPAEQVPAMLQTLLAERFKMTVHRETKEQPVYALVAGKNGPKLKKAEAGGFRGGPGMPPPPPPGAGGRGAPLPGKRGMMMMSSNGHLEARQVTMGGLSDMLSTLLDRPVVDMTGIEGEYDVTLDVAPEELVGMRKAMPAGAPPPEHARAPGESGPAPEAAPSASIFTAVQQLGLKLESRKAPIDYVVVDKAEKIPTEN
jgi:uncharacterized protein (TIGR03435 family)